MKVTIHYSPLFFVFFTENWTKTSYPSLVVQALWYSKLQSLDWKSSVLSISPQALALIYLSLHYSSIGGWVVTLDVMLLFNLGLLGFTRNWVIVSSPSCCMHVGTQSRCLVHYTIATHIPSLRRQVPCRLDQKCLVWFPC